MNFWRYGGDFMLKTMKHWWNNEPEIEISDQPIELTVTQLLVSMMKMDDNLHPKQRAEVIHLLQTRFQLSETAAEGLCQKVVQSDSPVPVFARLAKQIRKHYIRSEIADLMHDIWQVAIADGHVDFQEERYLSRISSLLGVPANMLTEAKLDRKAA